MFRYNRSPEIYDYLYLIISYVISLNIEIEMLFDWS